VTELAEPASYRVKTFASVSKDWICSITGLSDRRIRQLSHDGYFPAPIRGVYQTEETLKGLFRYYRTKQEERSTLTSERLRKTRAEADRVELEVCKARGQVVEIEAVYGWLAPLFVAYRARILSSSLTDPEKDELLADLMRLKCKIPENETPKKGD
jgi:hypothetical protein